MNSGGVSMEYVLCTREKVSYKRGYLELPTSS